MVEELESFYDDWSTVDNEFHDENINSKREELLVVIREYLDLSSIPRMIVGMG